MNQMRMGKAGSRATATRLFGRSFALASSILLGLLLVVSSSAQEPSSLHPDLVGGPLLDPLPRQETGALQTLLHEMRRTDRGRPAIQPMPAVPPPAVRPRPSSGRKGPPARLHSPVVDIPVPAVPLAEERGHPELVERLLLPLVREERALLTEYGQEHPKVLSVRERMQVVRDFIARQQTGSGSRKDGVPGSLVLTTAESPSRSHTKGMDGPVDTGVRKNSPIPEQTPPREPPTVSPHPQAANSTPVPERGALVTFVHIVGGLVGLMVVVVAALVGLLYVLRRSSGGGPLISVSLVNTQTSVPSENSVPARPRPRSPAKRVVDTTGRVETPEQTPQREPALAPVVTDVQETTAQPFELGPSYEEEQLQRRQAQQQQDAGILQQIFEQNMQLRQEIARVAEQPRKTGSGRG